MTKGFKLTNRAKEDLRGIWNYTLHNWSESQADHNIPHKYMDVESYFS